MSPSTRDGPPDLGQQLSRLRQEQERLSAQLHAGELHFRHLARSVWRVQEDERRRLARELHDGVGQNLTALGHRLQAIAARESAGSVPNELVEAIALCESALADTRALSRLLRPQILDDLGLDAALRWLTRSTTEATGIDVSADIGELPAEIDNEIATALFRVAQEALTNAVKHASAKHIVLRLVRRDAQLLLLVVDDGVGCKVDDALASASQGRSTGMASMRERLRLFGGRFQFDSQPGQGSQVRATLPLLLKKANEA